MASRRSRVVRSQSQDPMRKIINYRMNTTWRTNDKLFILRPETANLRRPFDAISVCDQAPPIGAGCGSAAEKSFPARRPPVPVRTSVIGSALVVQRSRVVLRESIPQTMRPFGQPGYAGRSIGAPPMCGSDNTTGACAARQIGGLSGLPATSHTLPWLPSAVGCPDRRLSRG